MAWAAAKGMAVTKDGDFRDDTGGDWRQPAFAARADASKPFDYAARLFFRVIQYNLALNSKAAEPSAASSPHHTPTPPSSV